MTYTAEAVVQDKGKAKASLKAEFARGNLKCEKLSLNHENKIETEFSLVEAIPKTKLTFKATDGSRASGAEAVTAKIGLERKDASSVATLDFDALNYNADLTAVVSYNKFLLGAQATASMGKGAPSVSDYNVLLAYKDAETIAGVQTSKKLSNVTVAYHQVVNGDLSAAAKASFPLASKPSASSSDFEFGVGYKAAKDTVVNAKVSAAGKVSVSYAQTISSLTKVTFATELDAANIGSDNHRFGMLLNISA